MLLTKCGGIRDVSQTNGFATRWIHFELFVYFGGFSFIWREEWPVPWNSTVNFQKVKENFTQHLVNVKLQINHFIRITYRNRLKLVDSCSISLKIVKMNRSGCNHTLRRSNGVPFDIQLTSEYQLTKVFSWRKNRSFLSFWTLSPSLFPSYDNSKNTILYFFVYY